MKRILKLALLSMAILTISAPFAGATAALYLTDGTVNNWIWINDNDQWDTNPLTGVITYSGTLNSITTPWIVNVTTGITKPILGNAAVPSMDLNSVNVTSSSGGNLFIWFSDVDFGPLPAGYGFQSMIGGTTVGNVTYATFLDAGNALWGTGTPLGTAAFGPGAFSGTFASGPVSPPSPYSLTQYVAITHTGAGATSFNGTLEAVPEPASLLLLGTGLSALGIWRLRRKNS